MPSPKQAHVIDEISFAGGVAEQDAPTTCSCGWEGTYAGFVAHRDGPKEDPMPRNSGPTLKQQEAWDLVAEQGLTQVEAAKRLGVTQAGIQDRLRGYQRAMGLTGPLPGLGGGNGPIRITRVPPEALDGPATTSAPEFSSAGASPSSARGTSEDTAAPAPEGSDSGAGAGDPAAPADDRPPMIAYVPDPESVPEPPRRVRPGRVEDLVSATTARVLDTLEAECERLSEVTWRIKSEIDEREAELQRTYPLLRAAETARDAYRAHLTGGDRA